MSFFAIGAFALAALDPGVAGLENSDGIAAINAVKAADCEIHVWGAGYPNRKLPKRLVKHLEKTNPPETFDRANPLSNVNTFDTAKRANALPEDKLKLLFPKTKTVSVIYHPEMIDQQETRIKKVKLPLQAGGTDCYADIVITDNIALWPSTRPRQNDVVKEGVAALLGGGNRFVTSFWMQYFPSAGGKRQRFKKRVDTDIPYAAPNTQHMSDVAKAATSANFDQFREHVQQKRNN